MRDCSKLPVGGGTTHAVFSIFSINKIRVENTDVYCVYRRTVGHLVFPDSFQERARGHTSFKLAVI